MPGFTLVDDPTNPRAYGAASYDAEGLACRRNVLIDNGVLRGFLYDTVSARRAGAGVDRLGGAGRLRRHPGAGLPGTGPDAGPEGYDEDGVLGRGRRGAVRAVDDRGPLRGQPDQRRLLGRGRGPDDPRTAAGRTGPRDHGGLDPAAHAPVGAWRSAPMSNGSPASPPVRPWRSATCRSAGSEPPGGSPLLGGGFGARRRGTRGGGVVDRTDEIEPVRPAASGGRGLADPQRGSVGCRGSRAGRSAPVYRVEAAALLMARLNDWITNSRGNEIRWR